MMIVIYPILVFIEKKSNEYIFVKVELEVN